MAGAENPVVECKQPRQLVGTGVAAVRVCAPVAQWIEQPVLHSGPVACSSQAGRASEPITL